LVEVASDAKYPLTYDPCHIFHRHFIIKKIKKNNIKERRQGLEQRS